MPNTPPPTWFASVRNYACLYCVAILLLASGCGESADSESSSVLQADPIREFEWGMTRLKRTVRISRPSGADGILVVDRKLKHKVFPPNDAQPNYTARVTIATETVLLQGRRKGKEKKIAAPTKESTIKDPLADQFEEHRKFIDIPGSGPQASTVASPILETRSIESKSVFELEYIEKHWQLTEVPKVEYEKLWFEYAFD